MLTCFFHKVQQQVQDLCQPKSGQTNITSTSSFHHLDEDVSLCLNITIDLDTSFYQIPHRQLRTYTGSTLVADPSVVPSAYQSSIRTFSSNKWNKLLKQPRSIMYHDYIQILNLKPWLL